MPEMKISICIPTYNQGLYIEQAVRSAASQTLQAQEIIVSNDCSTDNTAEILEKLKAEFPILKVVNQPHNLGISENVNQCLRMASSEFIIRLDSDDCLMKEYSEIMTALLNDHPDAGYAHCAIQEINENGKQLRRRFLSRKAVYLTGDQALKAAVYGYKVAANILMFRKTALEKVDFITCSINFAEDYYLTASISSQGFGNVYSDKVLALYRVWSDAGKVRQKRKLAEIKGIRLVFEEVLEPAFLSRNWETSRLQNQRSKFASIHSDALSWRVYSKQEKNELKLELLKLSDSKLLNLHIWMNMNGLSFFLSGLAKVKFSIKAFLKFLLNRVVK